MQPARTGRNTERDRPARARRLTWGRTMPPLVLDSGSWVWQHRRPGLAEQHARPPLPRPRHDRPRPDRRARANSKSASGRPRRGASASARAARPRARPHGRAPALVAPLRKAARAQALGGSGRPVRRGAAQARVRGGRGEKHGCAGARAPGWKMTARTGKIRPRGGGESARAVASGKTAKLRLAKPDGRVPGRFNGKAGWTRRS